MVYIVLLSFGIFLPSVFCNCRQSSRENTDLAYTNMLIPNFVNLGTACRDLRAGRTEVCSDECKETVNTMTTTYPWLFECDCQHGIKGIYSTNDCIADRERLPRCFEPENSCSKMYKVCNDSATCRMNLDDYLHDCKSELSMYEHEIGCDTVCMFAYDQLLFDPDAEGLWGCSCDDKSRDWCQNFINRTDCLLELSYIDPPDPSDSLYPPDDDIETQLPPCSDKMKGHCGGDLDCQNTIGGDLLQLVECDQGMGPDDNYNCSSECAMKLQQMKQKYPFLYECDCQKSLPTYHTDICFRDKERFEDCGSKSDLNRSDPSCSSVFPCLQEPSKCSSSVLYNFLTNCSSAMFSKDPEDMQCTAECLTAYERLFNSTEGEKLMQCSCDSADELCMSFQEESCVVLRIPSSSNRLSANVFMTYFILFITLVLSTKRNIQEIVC